MQIYAPDTGRLPTLSSDMSISETVCDVCNPTPNLEINSNGMLEIYNLFSSENLGGLAVDFKVTGWINPANKGWFAYSIWTSHCDSTDGLYASDSGVAFLEVTDMPLEISSSSDIIGEDQVTFTLKY